MAKADAPGFLSKVARFVRNPLTNWADLDQPETDKDGNYSKAILKEMIERKRRNDFVRKREFDQLRKLRSRGLMGFDPADRPSFFQSSLPSSPDERNATLKKIDEIEAQMSQQWWKSKPGGDSSMNPSTRATQATQQSSLPSAGASSLADRSSGHAATEASMLRTSENESPAPNRAVVPSAAPEASATAPASFDLDRPPGLAPLPGLSRQIAERADAAIDSGFVHDPELEEAAIRFANGDHEGAEAALKALIAPGAQGVDRAQTWLTLFDLYRATGQHDRFDNIAIDFAKRFGRSAPVWIAFSDAAGSQDSASSGPAPLSGSSTAARGFSWSAPEMLTVKVMSGLATALAKAPEPWRFKWTRFESIDDSALEPLLRMVGQWCSSPVQLRFVGADQLAQVLAAATPVSDRTVNPLRWRLRMELLRLMGRADEFDLAALDYCITYEVSPPSWTDAQCIYQEVDSDGGITGFQALETGSGDAKGRAETRRDSITGPHTLPQATFAAEHSTARLSGQLIGDAAGAIEQLENSVQGGKSLAVRCDKLARVDFSAAGSVLNWVAARHADGCEVQFTHVQRLVAVFFNIIGINEYARVTARHN